MHWKGPPARHKEGADALVLLAFVRRGEHDGGIRVVGAGNPRQNFAEPLRGAGKAAAVPTG